MESTVMIRRARPDERAAIRDLTLLAYGQFASIMELSAWTGLRDAVESALSTDRGGQQIVAELGGVLVGSVMLFPPSANAYGTLALRIPSPEIRLLAVAPTARGLGVARRLVQECMRTAREAGADAIGLHTSPSMRDAIRLYEKFGFTRSPEYDLHVDGAEPIHAYQLPLVPPRLTD